MEKFPERVKVYSKEHCVQCTATYRGLNSEGIEFDVIDLETLPHDQVEAWKQEGHMQAPIVEAAGEIWSGFQPDKIKALGRIGIERTF